jgi:hypothetical protein
MGFVDSSIAYHSRALTAGDYVQIAVLGCAAREPLEAEDLAQAVRTLAGHLWSPTAELIDEVAGSLLSGGGLALLPGPRFQVTPTGRRRLLALLGQPVQGPLSAFGQVGVRLKLAFLDLLPEGARRHQVSALICAYEGEIAARGTRCTAWPINGSLGRAWLDHQMDGLEDGLTLLKRLAEI